MNNENNTNNLPEKFTQNLSTLKQSLRLSPDESRMMRESLSAYADVHSASSVRSKPSPYISSFSFFYSRSFVASLLIFILILGTGTSVTYAAGNALPGQTLYPVKVDVAEPIEGAVIAATSGTTGSATWQNTLAERRITEATTLAAENDLSTSTQAYLENQTEIHVAQSDDDSAKLAAAGDISDANEVRSDLQARLAAHAELLAIIEPRLAALGDASTTSQVALLLNNVTEAQAAILFKPDSGEATTTSTTVATVSTSAASETAATTTVTVVAIADTGPTPAFRRQEARFFAANAHILSLLPATTTASTSLSQNGKKGLGTATTTTTSSTTVMVTATTTTESVTPDSPTVAPETTEANQ
jgi:hypothetical protein